MSNAKNNEAAKTAGIKSNATTDAVITGASTEEVAAIVEGTVPAQNDGKSVAEKEENLIVDETEIVDEPSFFQKTKSVFTRNRKVIFAVGGVIVIGVLMKLAKGVELEDEDATSSDSETNDESDVTDETLAV